MDEEQPQHLRDLLRTHQRHLRVLEQQAAGYGALAIPPHILLQIEDQRHARYWMEQAFPLLLLIRNAEGEVRWMDVRDWLKRATDDGKKAVRQIVFEGQRFDVMSVRRWRDQALG